MPTTAADSPPAPVGADGFARWRRALAAPRAQRAMAFGGLALLVVLLHGALLRSPAGAPGRPQRQTAAPPPVRVVAVSVPTPAKSPQDAARTLAPSAPAAPPTAPRTVPPRAARPPPPAAVLPLRGEPAAERRARPPAAIDAAAVAVTVADAPVTATLRPDMPASVPPDVPPAPAPTPMVQATPAADIAPPTFAAASASQATPPEGTPPPVYPTEIPANRTLDYRVLRGDAVGSGQLRWAATPGDYTLSLQASAPGGPALDWVSAGGFDSAGLAPQRMVERQRGRDMHAVNFQRDKQLISFSGPGRVEPLLRGAQDRLSWLVQLAAVAQAQRGALKQGDTLRLQVASPRGDVDEWRFTVGPAEVLELAGSRWTALKLVREPQRPYDQRVEVWLAPSAGHLPLGLTLTTVPGGVPLQLWLSGGLQRAL